MQISILVAALLVMFAGIANAAAPTAEEMWRLMQQQQAQIDALQASVRAHQQRLEEAQSRLESASQALQQSAENRDAIETQGAQLDTAMAMSEATANAIENVQFGGGGQDVSIGGYGELHYNNTDGGDEMDFHRFVLFIGHEFTDELSFYSELELEHSLAGDGKPGEMELEQAFVQWDYAPGQNVKMGLFLLPVGQLNLTHEPDTFFGVERNRIENQIIPTTWWEAGVMLDGEIVPGWNYEVAVHSGLNLDTTHASASRRSSIRSARQKVAEANADSLAYTFRLGYTGMPGLSWHTAFQYQSDLTQGDDEAIGIGEIAATLFETNVALQRGMFGLRGLYARWDVDDRINTLNPGADTQTGWYLEPSLRFDNGLGVFARYGRYDTTAGSGAPASEKGQLDIGLNYWLSDTVVIKADVQRQDNDSGTETDGFNLGVGYSF